jgi:hypothetical protein
MKQIRSMMFLTIGLLFSQLSYSQNYYVCNDIGINDTANGRGTTPEAPWATFDYAISKFNSLVNLNTAQTGETDAILFCRGGTFTSSYPRIFNQRCSNEKRCTLADYYPADALSNAPLPVIWGNIYGALNFQDGGPSDSDGGYNVTNLNLKGIGDGFGVMMFNDVNYVTMFGLRIEGFGVGVHSAGSNAPNPGADTNNDHIELLNSVIVDNVSQGWLGGGDNITIQNNKFENNGFGKPGATDQVRNHSIYVSHIHDSIIAGNTLTKSALKDGKCTGDPLVGHGVIDNLSIMYNTVYEEIGAAAQTCWGISIDPGYFSEESFSNIRIAYNKVSNVGNVVIGCASCVDFQIDHNSILHAQDFTTTGVRVPVRTEDTVKSDRGRIDWNYIVLTDPNNRGKYGVVINSTNDITESNNTVIDN